MQWTYPWNLICYETHKLSCVLVQNEDIKKYYHYLSHQFLEGAYGEGINIGSSNLPENICEPNTIHYSDFAIQVCLVCHRNHCWCYSAFVLCGSPRSVWKTDQLRGWDSYHWVLIDLQVISVNVLEWSWEQARKKINLKI